MRTVSRFTNSVSYCAALSNDFESLRQEMLTFLTLCSQNEMTPGVYAKWYNAFENSSPKGFDYALHKLPQKWQRRFVRYSTGKIET